MVKYDSKFYDGQAKGSLRSAQKILVPLLNSLTPKSVVDIGCGVGPWLKTAIDHNVKDILGLDGAYVDINQLMIPRSNFRAIDLSSDWRIEQRFDLAISLEVAEHLPVESAQSFIEQLTSLSDVVLFSAAIPYQGGTGHVNENWPAFWLNLFTKQGFELFDAVRPKHWDDPDIAYWYRQNIFLYAKKGSTAALRLGLPPGPQIPLTAVHPESYLYAVSRGTVLSKQRVNEAIEALTANAIQRKINHSLDAFPILAMISATKKIIKAALPSVPR